MKIIRVKQKFCEGCGLPILAGHGDLSLTK